MDRLAIVASGMNESILPWEVERKVVEIPSVGGEVNGVELKEPDWTKEIEKYLNTCELPIDKEEARKVKMRATQFTELDGILYKQALLPLPRCISPQEAQFVLTEIHE